MRRTWGTALLAVLCAGPPPAAASVIRGVVRVPSRPALVATAVSHYPGHANAMPGRPAIARGRVEDAVVYVDHLPADADSALGQSNRSAPRLAQKDEAFVPRVLAIAVGASVDFPNLDPIYHNVFSLSPARRFDLGKYPQGASRQVVFHKPGVVNVFCDIHSDMEAFILVLPHHGFARPSPSGEYTLPGLPAGRYVLCVWHPDLGKQSVTVEVPDHGELTADLSY